MGPASTAERQQNSHLGPEKPESSDSLSLWSLSIPELVRMVLDEIRNTIRTMGTGHAAPQAHQTPAEEKCSSSRTYSTDLLWLIVGVSVRCLEMDRAVGVF